MAAACKMDTEDFTIYCTICNDYIDEESESIHIETERHILVEVFYSNRKLFNLINSNHPIKVTPSHFNVEDNVIKVHLNQENTVIFNVHNISNSSMAILDMFGLTNQLHVQVVNIKKPTKPVVILKGESNNSYNVGVIITDNFRESSGFFKVPIAFTYCSSTCRNFVLELNIEIETDWPVMLLKEDYIRQC
ncbi:uncharacterized protein LOC142332162 [Lycorma delicatula]|uniref:uncharacterized protein LOC142332162 n=1 Tax=Lycorma delicatula TaxID=130591 RepID=UPI003F510C21